MRRERFRRRAGSRQAPPSALFADLDETKVARVAETLGTRMIQATALACLTIGRDDTIDPTTMSAGIVQAHLIGAASALQAALNAGTLVGSDLPAIARDAAAMMVDLLATMKAAA